MADEPDNLVLKLLRKIDDRLTHVAEDVHDLNIRATSLEENMAVLNRRVDRIENRLERIETRLGLVEVGSALGANPSPACGRRWPDEVGSDEGTWRLLVENGMRGVPSSDPASRGHLRPQAGEGEGER